MNDNLNPEDLYGMSVTDRLPDHQERGEAKAEGFVAPNGQLLCQGCEKSIPDDEEPIFMSVDPYSPPFCNECAKEYSDRIDEWSEAMHILEFVRCLDDGKTVGEMAFTGTTEIFVKEKPGEAIEVRCGFAVMGHTNMDEAGYRRALKNPFHPQFHDNYAIGKGATIEEALKKMGESVQDMSQAFFH